MFCSVLTESEYHNRIMFSVIPITDLKENHINTSNNGNPLYTGGGGQFGLHSHILQFVAKIYNCFYLSMVCKLGPWSYLSFIISFLGIIGPLLIKWGHFLHGQSVIFYVIKSDQTHNLAWTPNFGGILFGFMV